MPESPECFTIAQQLHFNLRGLQLTKITPLTDKFPLSLFGGLTLPATLQEVQAKGKLIRFTFLSGLVENTPNRKVVYMYSNLGMTGEWGCVQKKHSHVYFKFEHPEKKTPHMSVFYTDMRRFGRLEVSETLDKWERLAPAFLGPNPIGESEFLLRLGGEEKRGIVKMLMDQEKICSGIGNYLLSEVLYAADIPHLSLIKEIPREKRVALYQACKRIIEAAYRAGGVSISDYKDFTGRDGRYQGHLQVYGRVGFVASNGKVILKSVGPHGRAVFHT